MKFNLHVLWSRNCRQAPNINLLDNFGAAPQDTKLNQMQCSRVEKKHADLQMRSSYYAFILCTPTKERVAPNTIFFTSFHTVISESHPYERDSTERIQNRWGGGWLRQSDPCSSHAYSTAVDWKEIRKNCTIYNVNRLAMLTEETPTETKRNWCRDLSLTRSKCSQSK
jgi:hypothetical protein